MIIIVGVDDLGNLDDMLDDDGGQENYRKIIIAFVFTQLVRLLTNTM